MEEQDLAAAGGGGSNDSGDGVGVGGGAGVNSSTDGYNTALLHGLASKDSSIWWELGESFGTDKKARRRFLFKILKGLSPTLKRV